MITLENKSLIELNVLALLNKKMADELYKARPDPDITKEECRELWESTVWHKIIKDEINKRTKDKTTYRLNKSP